MTSRVIKVIIHEEQALYDELYSAMMEHREYDGGYVMQYTEQHENGLMIATFTLRDAEQSPTESE